MKKIAIKGENSSEKINHIEKVINRLAIRSRKTITGVISPQNISTCIEGEDVRGDIIKCMIFGGKLSKLHILFGKKPKGNICIEVKTLGYETGQSKTLYTNKIKYSTDIDIKVTDGTCLVVSIYPTNEDEKIGEIWVAMLWTPDIPNSDVRQELIDSLENDLIEE